MTERGRGDLARDEIALQIGPSHLHWDGTALTIQIDERTVPFPSRILGSVRVVPAALPGKRFALEASGRHNWHPIGPVARIEVELRHPALRWRGNAYLDSNFGDEPLEEGFTRWDWMRAPVPGGTAVLYDTERRDGSAHTLALRFDEKGAVEAFRPPPRGKLPTTLWGVRRFALSDDGQPRLIKTVEDTPFYARSLVSLSVEGTQTIAMHESLSLDRVANPIVRAMLPFRMPRYRRLG